MYENPGTVQGHESTRNHIHIRSLADPHNGSKKQNGQFQRKVHRRLSKHLAQGQPERMREAIQDVAGPAPGHCSCFAVVALSRGHQNWKRTL